MSNSLDVHRLLAEVEKRPSLWDFKPGDRKSRLCTPKLWQEIAEILGADAEMCKMKWRLLRDSYRTAVRRVNQRIERDKLMGVYDPDFNYTYKLDEFPSLAFLSKSGENPIFTVHWDKANLSKDESNHNDKARMENVHGHIKLERILDTDEDYDDDDAENDTMFEEFQDIDAPQPPKRLSAITSNRSSLEKHNVRENDEPSTSNDQVHISEELGSKGDIEIKTTERDMTRSIKSDRISDTDYNFLISFLPQMKKMSELQNAKFRAKVCDMVLNIFAENKHDTNGGFSKQPPATDQSKNTINSSTFNCNS